MSMLGFEFTAEQNKGVGALARALRQVMVPLIGCGVLEALFGGWLLARWGLASSLLGVLSLLAGLGALGLALFLGQAALSLRLIVDTEGADVDHLMRAVGSLKRSLYGGVLLVWLLCLGLFGGIVDRVAGF